MKKERKLYLDRVKSRLENLEKVSLARAKKLDDELSSLNEEDFQARSRKIDPLVIIAESLRDIAVRRTKEKAAKKDVKSERLRNAFRINREGSC